MKKLLTLILLIQTILTYSQDWSGIKINSIAYYSSDSTFIHSVRIDSSIVREDTVIHFPFKMLRKDSFGLYRELGDNWIGGQIKVLSNGINIFYNHKHEPILLRTKATLNETWPCYYYSDSSFIEAKINSIDVSNYLEQTDSIKTITFQLKDKTGIIISNQSDSCKYINSSLLVLSKYFGFWKIIDFYKFPISNINEIEDIYGSDYQYNLIGMTNPQIGFKKPTAKDFYDFDIGDEIHWQYLDSVSGFDRYTGTNYSYYYVTQNIDEVLSKNIVSNDSTVVYSLNRTSKKSSSFNTDIEYTNETITSTYDLYPIYWYSPDLYEPLEPTYLSFYVYNNQYVKRYYIDDPARIDEVYYKNAGYYYTQRSLPTPWELHVTKYSLQYYTHGKYSWGIPTNLIIIQDSDNYELLKIYPNPASNVIYFNKRDNSNVSVMISDLSGKQLLLKNTFENFIDISSLPKGLYIIRLIDSNNTIVNRFLKY